MKKLIEMKNLINKKNSTQVNALGRISFMVLIRKMYFKINQTQKNKKQTNSDLWNAIPDLKNFKEMHKL